MKHSPRRATSLHAQTRRVCAVLTILLMHPLACPRADAQADKTAERNARRAQLQMQELKQQLDAALAAKTQAEAAKAEAEKRQQADAQAVTRLSSALKKTETARKALMTDKAELSTRVAALQGEFSDSQRGTAQTLADKERDFAAQIKTREAAQGQLQTRFDQQLAAVAECSSKNERLVALGAELLERYRKKDFAAVLSQNEPVLGLGDVQMFNLVQDYRDRTDAERFRAASRR